MKTPGVVIALVLAFFAPAAQSSPITFNLTGVPGISGYVQYDSSALHGFFEFVPNSAIVGLSIDVFGASFDLGDLVNIPGFSAAFIDSSGPVPLIINGFGLLADNGVNAIAYYPDGFGNTPLDGDAALSFQLTGGSFPAPTYPVHWTVAAVPEPSTIALLALGLGGLARARRPAA